MIENGNKARISTGFLNTVNDVQPGSIVNNNTGVATYPGLLGKQYHFTHAMLAKRWKTATGALPDGDLVVQYIKTDELSAIGQIAYWLDKNGYEVTNVDTANLPVAGVYISIISDEQYGFIAKIGRPYTKFKSSTTKVTPDIGDIALGISGNTGLADVLADATAQTYGTDADNRKVGKLASVVTAQLAQVDISIVD